MAPTTLTDLPPELLDQIATYLPTARSVVNLGRTNKSLHAFVEKEEDAWKNFNPARFPSLCPTNPPSHRGVARTLTTLAKAWDRRAFVARYIEPNGNIRAFPGDKKIERWKRPRGQTIGFTPQLDCVEEFGSSWRVRKEVLAFSAGAEICVRWKNTESPRVEDTRWIVYRPLDALEGRDDITSLQLLRVQDGESHVKKSQELITGSANGDLQLLSLSGEGGEDIPKAHFVTQGQPVRSTSLLQQAWKPSLLAANIGDDCVSLYETRTDDTNIQPISSIRIQRPRNSHRAYRTWSTNFLSSETLAVGVGPSDEPLHIYSLTPSGIQQEALRKYSLENHTEWREDEITSFGSAKKSRSSVYPVVPLPASSGLAGNDGQIFLSGGHDGVIRLHDLRSNRDVERTYIDPTDDSAIYSLLPRGREKLVAGTSRHSLLKVFDMRLGAKAYTYLDNYNPNGSTTERTEMTDTKDWNLFLKPHSATYPGRGGGNNWARRSAESSIYSLASPSPCSPHVYAGVENAVLDLAFTSVLDCHPDPISFLNPPGKRRSGETVQGFQPKEVLNLAMYDQTADMMKLKTQRSLWETFQVRQEGENTITRNVDSLEGLDERWKIVSA